MIYWKPKNKGNISGGVGLIGLLLFSKADSVLSGRMTKRNSGKSSDIIFNPNPEILGGTYRVFS